MIRINLLPPEILEKRKVESRRLYLVAVLLGVLAVLGLAWGFLLLQQQLKMTEVASAQQEAESLQAQAAKFKVFEDRTKDLSARRTIAASALAGRVNWSKLMSEVALVLPSDLWLDRFAGNEGPATTGSAAPAAAPAPGKGATAQKGASLVLEGWCKYQEDAGPDNGFKPLAKLLVRLNDLAQLKSVWLDTAAYKPAGYLDQDAADWATSSEIIVPGSSAATGSAAPPPPPSQ